MFTVWSVMNRSLSAAGISGKFLDMELQLLPLEKLYVQHPASILYILNPEWEKKTVRQGMVKISKGESSVSMAYTSLHHSLADFKGLSCKFGLAFMPEWVRLHLSLTLYDNFQLEFIEGTAKLARRVELRPLIKIPTFTSLKGILKGVIIRPEMALSLAINSIQCPFIVKYLEADEMSELYECNQDTEVFISEMTKNGDTEHSEYDVLETVFEHDIKQFLLNIEASKISITDQKTPLCHVHMIYCDELRIIEPFKAALMKSHGLTSCYELDLYGLATDDEIETADNQRVNVINRIIQHVVTTRPSFVHIKYPSRFESHESVKLIDGLILRIHLTDPGINVLSTDIERPKKLLKSLERHAGLVLLEFTPSPLSHAGRKEYLTYHLKHLNSGIERIIDEYQWRLNGFGLSELDCIIQFVNTIGYTEDLSTLFREAFESIEESGRPEYIRLMSRGQCSWDDIFGYQKQIEKVKNMIYGPWKQHEIYSKFGINKSPGILLYGPSGCGKSSIVHAIANDGIFNVLELDLSELKSKYLGETEERLRHAFAMARQNSPCILFIDNIDTFGKRRSTEGGDEGSGGAEERLLSTLLNEMDGIEELGAVTVIGCTNRIDAIDSALKRPGRLDCHLEFPLPDASDRRIIIEGCSVGMDVTNAPGDVIEALVEKTVDFSCAEILQLFQDVGRERIQTFADNPTKSNIQFSITDVLHRLE